MALNIKNEAVERLVAELARTARLRRFLETEVWPGIPSKELGRRMSRKEEDEILGYGREGV